MKTSYYNVTGGEEKHQGRDRIISILRSFHTEIARFRMCRGSLFLISGNEYIGGSLWLGKWNLAMSTERGRVSAIGGHGVGMGAKFCFSESKNKYF